MEDLSLHILDIVENSVAAKADKIKIGMDEETKKQVLDPFYTTKTVRQFGLGLPLLSEAAKAANGHLSIQSKKGEGTRIKATFQHSHIDRRPLGDIAQTILTIIIGNPEIDIIFLFENNGFKYSLDTRKIRVQLMETPLNSPAGIRKIREDLKKLNF